MRVMKAKKVARETKREREAREDAEAMNRPCIRCLAMVGEGCMSEEGRKLGYAHSVRFYSR